MDCSTKRRRMIHQHSTGVIGRIIQKLMSLLLTNILTGKFLGLRTIDDINRLKYMNDICSIFRQGLLMKSSVLLMLVERLISMPGQSSFRYPKRLVRGIFSRQKYLRRLLENSVFSISSHNYEITDVVFCPSKNLMVTGSIDLTSKLYDMSDGKCKGVARLDGHRYAVLCVAIHESGEWIVTGSNDKTIRLWKNTHDCGWECVKTLVDHTDVVTSVKFHKSLPIFLSGSNDKTAKVWLLDPEHNSAHCVTTLSGHSRDINAVAIHPILPIFATASDDRTVKMWKLLDDLSATCVATLTGHTDYVTWSWNRPDINGWREYKYQRSNRFCCCSGIGDR